jgi:hypothetical protein
MPMTNVYKVADDLQALETVTDELDFQAATQTKTSEDLYERTVDVGAISNDLAVFVDSAGGTIARQPNDGPAVITTTDRLAGDVARRALMPTFDKTAGIGDMEAQLHDANGRPFVGVDRLGRVRARGANGRYEPLVTAYSEPPRRLTDTGANYSGDPTRWLRYPTTTDVGIVCLAQSLGTGAASYDESTVSYSTTDIDGAVMPSTSDGASYRGIAFTEYMPAKAIELFAAGSGVRTYGEMPIFEAARYFLARCQAAFSVKPRCVLTVVARGGYTLNQLAPGTLDYQQLIDAVKMNVAASLASGRNYEVCHVMLAHGESMVSVPYEQALGAYRSVIEALCADFRRLTGQQTDPIFHAHSPDRNLVSGDVRLGTGQRVFQTLAIEQRHRFKLVGGTYSTDMGAAPGDGHPIIYGYRELGALYGDSIWEAETSYGSLPCMVVEVTRAAANAVDAWVLVPKSGTLVRDETGAIIGYPTIGSEGYIGPDTGSAAHDGGFWARDLTGALGVESATLGSVGPDGTYPVRLVFHRNYDVGSTVIMVAARPDNSGNTYGVNSNGARSIFRGSVGLSAIPDQTRTIYHWLVPSQHRI